MDFLKRIPYPEILLPLAAIVMFLLAGLLSTRRVSRTFCRWCGKTFEVREDGETKIAVCPACRYPQATGSQLWSWIAKTIPYATVYFVFYAITLVYVHRMNAEWQVKMEQVRATVRITIDDGNCADHHVDNGPSIYLYELRVLNLGDSAATDVTVTFALQRNLLAPRHLAVITKDARGQTITALLSDPTSLVVRHKFELNPREAQPLHIVVVDVENRERLLQCDKGPLAGAVAILSHRDIATHPVARQKIRPKPVLPAGLQTPSQTALDALIDQYTPKTEGDLLCPLQHYQEKPHEITTADNCSRVAKREYGDPALCPVLFHYNSARGNGRAFYKDFGMNFGRTLYIPRAVHRKEFETWERASPKMSEPLRAAVRDKRFKLFDQCRQGA